MLITKKLQGENKPRILKFVGNIRDYKPEQCQKHKIWRELTPLRGARHDLTEIKQLIEDSCLNTSDCTIVSENDDKYTFFR